MDLRYRATRLVDVARGLRTAKEATARERWPREQLESYRQQRLDRLVRFAVQRSPFYGERLAGLPATGPVDLRALPTLDKHTMMDRFDDLVTDRRLRRDALLRHLDGLDHDALCVGEHRVMVTSGSSGSKGLFVYDRQGWVEILAQLFRFNQIAGVRPRLPRLRVAAIGGGSPTHMTRRAAATLAVGIHRVLSLSVTMPLSRLVEELNAFQPDYLNAFPSIAVLLADEQRAGRLNIAPEVISTSSELRTPEATDRIAAAFGVRPFDLYGTTEGLWAPRARPMPASTCTTTPASSRTSTREGRLVAAGERGARLLVTNLFTWSSR
jgi:phenylacetate-CoA ligase